MSKILMVGSGPVAIQLARLCNLHGEHMVDMVSRVHASTKSKRVFDAYHRDGFFSVMTQNDAHQCFSGKFTVRHFFKDVKDITQYYDVVILACTADAYRPILQQLSKSTLKRIKQIILVSPTLGSHMLVKQILSDVHCEGEVISFSTYLGDTRIFDKAQPHCVLTTRVKSKLFVGSTHSQSITLYKLKSLFDYLNIELTTMDTPLHAEIHNSSLYVHPPLFMNQFSLKAVFEGTKVPVYVYKLFPEGPITMTLIHEIRLMWQEMMMILKKLKVPSVNLLKFMVKENYPIRDFSNPDDQGAYFDFSAVPYKHVDTDEQGVIHIPRMPSEDYYRTLMIQAIGRALNVATPMIDTLLLRYETTVKQYCDTHLHQQLSKQFELHHFKQDLALVTNYLTFYK
ncbi:MAG: opine metallophore biosynthesis dehydrogenase [Staphylococcus epidermidis]|nr:opine metallophore biosynthesis dehydrogenase [Staphylococcus epidermidis]